MKIPFLIGRLVFGGYFLYAGINIALLGGALALMAIEEPWPASVPVAQPGRVDRLRKLSSNPHVVQVACVV